jgi:hypothetical protein
MFAITFICLSVFGAQMKVAYNPYETVNWYRTLRCLAQHHDHIGVWDKIIRAYDEAGYRAVSTMDYSGVASLDYSWHDRKWPVYPYLGYGSDAAFFQTCAHLKLFIPNAEEFGVGYVHFTSPFLTSYIAKWEPAYYPEYAGPQQWHYTSAQECIDAIARYGGLPCLAHPWDDPAEYLGLQNLRATEIYSAYCTYQEKYGSPDEKDLNARLLRSWDALLSNTSTRIWGIAVNDHYGPGNEACRASDPWIWDSGKIEVLVREYSLEAYRAAFDHGAFFAIRDNRIIKGHHPFVNNICVNSWAIVVNSDGLVVWFGNGGRLVGLGDRLELSCLPAGLTYVRAEVWKLGTVLYLQPFSLAPVSTRR